MLPVRSLAKYKNLPSGDQTGFQFVEASFVINSISPPSRAIVAMSLRPELGGMNQNAIRNPFGDHEGCIASFPHSMRFAPFSGFTIHNALSRVFLVAGAV